MTQRGRVLRVIARLNVGGPARHVVIANDGLRRLGWDTLLVHGRIGKGEASLDSLARDRGLAVCSIPQLGRTISPLDDARALARIVRLMFRYRPDVVHTHTAKAGTLGRIAAAVYNATRRRNGRALVVHTFHGHVLEGYFGRAGNWAVRTAERLLARVTDRIVVISERQKDDLERRFRIAPGERISVVPLGLELEPMLALPEPGLTDRVTFAFVGRLVPVKNLPLLLRAFSIATCRTAYPLKLIVAGGGELAGDLQALTRDLNLTEAVEFRGWCSDLPGLYSEVDVLVLSSRNEGTPVSAIEALAAARPVIATSVGGVADVVRHEITGLLVPAGDVESFAAAMTRLASDPAFRRRLGRGGREDVSDRFGRKRLVENLNDLYETGTRELRGSCNIGSHTNYSTL